MGFTDFQKSRIKHFLGYPDWQSLSNGIGLGIPTGYQSMFLVEQSFQRLTAGGEQSVLRDLQELESIECQISDARKRMKATSIGDLKVNREEVAELTAELGEWTQRLSNDLGAPVNPYTFEARSGGMNAKVIG